MCGFRTALSRPEILSLRAAKQDFHSIPTILLRVEQSAPIIRKTKDHQQSALNDSAVL